MRTPDTISNIDRLAKHLLALFPGTNGDIVFTTSDRMDGVTLPADRLIILDASCKDYDRF